MSKKIFFVAAFAAVAAVAAPVFAATVVDVTGTGVEKIGVSVNVDGDPAFSKSLVKNLDLTGCFQLSKNASVKVTGSVGSSVRVEGRGKALTLPSSAADAKSARMEARMLADKMSEIYAHQKGFACDRIAFVTRKGASVSELCACYPDGYDIVQLTSDGKTVVGPRWNGKGSLYFTGIRDSGPQIFEYAMDTGRSLLKWSFRGLATGAVPSPDGRRVAIILSIHGNPELYIIDIASRSWTRLTTTPYASEGQPSWSPDGRHIVYVSNESRKQHLYVIDVATKRSSVLTKDGSQNADPDWGADNRIAFVTKRREGGYIAVIDMNGSNRTPQLVGDAGAWEHPSWSRDGRHVVAERDKALFVVDTTPPEKGGDKPKQLFLNAGSWINPSWSR
ncbi:MAG: PD40 domain-containing protein [Kiritimatiellae bacterium]|nr:PD40 domain-containing protein [Kiritimatiellia bacterium]